MDGLQFATARGWEDLSELIQAYEALGLKVDRPAQVETTAFGAAALAGLAVGVWDSLEELEQLVIDARFECTGPYARLTTTEYAATLNKMLGLIRSIDEVNES